MQYNKPDRKQIQVISELINQEGEGKWEFKVDQLKSKGIYIKDGKKLQQIWHEWNYTTKPPSLEEAKDIIELILMHDGILNKVQLSIHAKYNHKRALSKIKFTFLRFARPALLQINQIFSRKKLENAKFISRLKQGQINNFIQTKSLITEDKFLKSINASAHIISKLLNLYLNHQHYERPDLYELFSKHVTKLQVENSVNHMKYIANLTRACDRIYNKEQKTFINHPMAFPPELVSFLFPTPKFKPKHVRQQINPEPQQGDSNSKKYQFVQPIFKRYVSTHHTKQYEYKLQLEKKLSKQPNLNIDLDNSEDFHIIRCKSTLLN